MPLVKTSLEARAIAVLESHILPELNGITATAKNTADIREKIQQISNTLASAVIDEIQQNAFVELSLDVMVLQQVVMSLLNAIISAPVAPMDGGATFKVSLITAAAPGLSTLSALVPRSTIK